MFFRILLSLTLILSLHLMISSTDAQDAQTKVPLTFTVLNKQAVATNPNLLGQNMTGIVWHGTEVRSPAFYDPKIRAVSPDWLPLFNAFPMRVLRMHWGNQYPWKDSVGPVDQRKTIKHDKWKNTLYRMQAGMDEYLQFAQSLKNPPLLSLIASPLRPIDELVDLVAYCNATSGPMAKWRAANGHPAPYNIKIWEMGNEIDYNNRGDMDILRQDTPKELKEKITVQEYMQLIKPRIAALKSVDPTIKIYVHAKTAPWYNTNPNWPLWHQALLKEMGNQFDGIVIHPYYDGYPVPVCIKSVDQVINDIKKYGPKNKTISVWVNEHARWVNFRKIEERPQSWSLQGAISSADFLIELMKRPAVQMANYWCYGERGPWRMVNVGTPQDPNQKFATAPHHMFQMFNQALLPLATPIQVDELEYNQHPQRYDQHFKSYTYNVSAMMFSNPASKARSLLTVNRSATQDFEARIKLPKLASKQASYWLLTADALTSTNVSQTPNATPLTQTIVPTQQDAAGIVTLTIPARSVALWRWE